MAIIAFGVMTYVNEIIGIFFRRWWGGWENPPHIVKVILGFIISGCMALLATQNLLASGAFSFIVGLAFMNPLHSWGMGMGYSYPDQATGKKWWQCALVMGGSYGAFTLAAAAALALITKNSWFWLYAVTGFLTPVPYLIAWPVFNKYFRYPDNSYHKFWETSPGVYFIDGPTAVGECFLGALLFSI